MLVLRSSMPQHASAATLGSTTSLFSVASLFLFFTSDSDLCPSPSTPASVTYSLKASKFMFSLFLFCSFVALEYACTGMLTEKSDVYSFGILIMEIITRRSLVNLIEWLKTMVGNRKSEELINPNLPEK
ncbi:hypothetical protein HN51_052295, partial [Arachis hypogaea]